MSQSFDRVRARTGAVGAGADPRHAVASGHGASVDPGSEEVGPTASGVSPVGVAGRAPGGGGHGPAEAGSGLAGDGPRRGAATRAGSGPGRRPVDVQGKAALFSRPVATPTLGTVAITCSACHDATVVSYLRALQLALPSLHLVVLRRDYPSWMRCPACDRRTWVRIRFA